MTPSVGTISYMAPEVIKGTSYTNKIDVYSYGILLWEMITRNEPFGDEGYIHVVCLVIEIIFIFDNLPNAFFFFFLDCRKSSERNPSSFT